ncbi:NADH-quinone oxidoreductase subunit H, partial [candidate division FCPU426 bacterium]|nr:NADH-quinone oxidoreductase subunit H [candidate division FCPU426 bacterium]
PLFAFASVITILLYLPFAGFAPVLEGYGDLILVLYLLAMPALAMVFGGVASGSPYATLGAQREMVTMIAYELPLGTIVVAFAWKMSQAGLAAPFSLQTIASHPVWNLVGPFGTVGFILLLLALVVVTPGELSQVPFDAPEAKSELAEGLLVEYSGRNLAMFKVALGAKMIAMAGLTVALFFPQAIGPHLGLPVFWRSVAEIVFYLLKLFAVIFVSITLMRISMARFRITQVMDVYWKLGGIITLLGLLLIMLDGLI